MRNNLLRKVELKIRNLRGFWRNREQIILSSICRGKGADIGCGSNKVSENCIGIDLFGKNERGRFGCEKDMISVADYKSHGDDLKMFKSGELDFIVAKHNLEHYKDVKKTLKEWKRVLKKDGKVGVIVPDDRFVNSPKLDATHFVSFIPTSLKKLFEDSGFKIAREGVAVPHWSIYLIAEK